MQIKAVLYTLAFAGLSFGAWYLYDTGYASGVQDEHQRHIEEFARLEQEQQKTQEALDKTIAELEAERIANKPETITKEIIKYVETSDPNTCLVDDVDFLRLYKDSIRADKGKD